MRRSSLQITKSLKTCRWQCCAREGLSCEIHSGQFAKEWMLENMANKPAFNALTKKGQAHPIEEVGDRLRKMMPWLQKGKLVDKSKH